MMLAERTALEAEVYWCKVLALALALALVPAVNYSKALVAVVSESAGRKVATGKGDTSWEWAVAGKGEMAPARKGEKTAVARKAVGRNGEAAAARV